MLGYDGARIGYVGCSALVGCVLTGRSMLVPSSPRSRDEDEDEDEDKGEDLDEKDSGNSNVWPGGNNLGGGGCDILQARKFADSLDLCLDNTRLSVPHT